MCLQIELALLIHLIYKCHRKTLEVDLTCDMYVVCMHVYVSK